VIPVAPTPAQDGADVPVDGLDHTEGHLHVAVGEDPAQVGQEQLGQRLEGGEPLPPERQASRGQEASGVRLVRVGSELRQLVPEQVGLGQATVDRKVVMGFRPPAPHENGPVWHVLFRTVTAIF